MKSLITLVLILGASAPVYSKSIKDRCTHNMSAYFESEEPAEVRHLGNYLATNDCVTSDLTEEVNRLVEEVNSKQCITEEDKDAVNLIKDDLINSWLDDLIGETDTLEIKDYIADVKSIVMNQERRYFLSFWQSQSLPFELVYKLGGDYTSLASPLVNICNENGWKTKQCKKAKEELLGLSNIHIVASNYVRVNYDPESSLPELYNAITELSNLSNSSEVILKNKTPQEANELLEDLFGEVLEQAQSLEENPCQTGGFSGAVTKQAAVVMYSGLQIYNDLNRVFEFANNHVKDQWYELADEIYTILDKFGHFDHYKPLTRH